jgi:hypothetical protein
MSGITKDEILDKLVCLRAKLSAYKKSGESVRNVISGSLYKIAPYSDVNSLGYKMDILKRALYRYWNNRND